VFFDDLNITHTKGKVLQEDHYYPFGLNISALSSTAPLSKPNRYKLSGNEEQTELDLNLYDFNARMYDATLGRFNSVDPMADLRNALTPYNYVQNSPMTRIDPGGMLDDIVSYGAGGSPLDRDRKNKWNRKEGDGNGQSSSRMGDMVLATCPTCPSDKKYDSNRKSDMNFSYDTENGAYLDGGEVKNDGPTFFRTKWNSTEFNVGVPSSVSGSNSKELNSFSIYSSSSGLAGALKHSNQFGWIGESGIRHSSSYFGQASFAPGLQSTAARIARPLKLLGNIGGVLSFGEVANQMGQGNYAQGALEAGFAGAGLSSHPFGVAASFGWEIGRAITTIPAYQRLKMNTLIPLRMKTFGY
jgi:RHS repeat-associated protein